MVQKVRKVVYSRESSLINGESSPLSKPSILIKSLKPLASLVSFDPFLIFRPFRPKSGRRVERELSTNSRDSTTRRVLSDICAGKTVTTRRVLSAVFGRNGHPEAHPKGHLWEKPQGYTTLGYPPGTPPPAIHRPPVRSLLGSARMYSPVPSPR